MQGEYDRYRPRHDPYRHLRLNGLDPGTRRFDGRWQAGSQLEPVGRARVRRIKTTGRLSPLRVRGLTRVCLHAHLTILAKLATALSRAGTLRLAA
jgi:hypothetical protein